MLGMKKPVHADEERLPMTQNGEEKTFSERKTSPVSRIGAVRVSRRGFIALASLISTVPIFAGLNGVGAVWAVLWGSLAAGAVFATDADKEDSAGSGTLIASVPLGFLLLAGWVTVVGVAAATVHLHVWNTRLGAATVWAVGMGLLIYAGRRRKGQVAVVGNDYATAGSYLILGSIGLWIFFTQSFEVWSRNVAAGTDYLRHLSFMKNTIVDGNLTYGTDVSFQTYPRSVHALAGVVWNAAGGPSYENAWKALESVSWLMLVFLFASLVLVASTVARKVGLSWWAADVLAPGVVLLILVQGAWINNLELGFIASIFSGVAVTAVFAYGVCSRWVGSTLSVLIGFLSFILLSHSWTVLTPVAGFLVLTCFTVWLRQGRKKLPIAGMVAAGILTLAISVPAFSAVVGISLKVAEKNNAGGNQFSILSTPGDSNLTAPTLWWITGVVISFITVVAVMRFRPTNRSQMWWYLMTIVPGLVLSAALIIVTHSTWRSIAYYPVKTLWTFLPLTLPLAIVGCAWILQIFLSQTVRSDNRFMRLAGFGTVLIVATCIIVTFAGRTIGSSYLKNKVQTVSSGKETLGSSILVPIAQLLEKNNLSVPENTQKIIVFGYTPHSNVLSLMSGKTQLFDVMGEDVGNWQGYKPVENVETRYLTVSNRTDPNMICALLAKNPEALYVTGPNPEAGPKRLLENGCPASTVQPEKWITVPISNEWFKETPLYGKPYDYPTSEEIKTFKEHKKEGGSIFG